MDLLLEKPNGHAKAKIDCGICQDTLLIKNVFSCSCGLSVCTLCAEQLEKANCPGCSVAWPFERMPKSFAKVQRNLEERRLFREEESQLTQALQFLQWTEEVDRLKRGLRFGLVKTLPPKPKAAQKADTMEYFSCPWDECRGFCIQRPGSIQNWTQCPACKKDACLQCHETHVAGHTCNKEILENLQALRKDCRNCPQCTTLIFKTVGCDHMICTRCRNHFDWKTGKPLKVSTNGHQNHTKVYDSNVILVTQRLCDQDETDLTKTWPDDAPSSLQNLIREIRHLQLLYKSKFVSIDYKHLDTLMDLRVKYLQKKMSQEDFSAKLFVLHETYRQMILDKQFLQMVIQILTDQTVKSQEGIANQLGIANQESISQNDLFSFFKDQCLSLGPKSKLIWQKEPGQPWVSLK